MNSHTILTIMASDSSIISSSFCLNSPLELVIVRKIWSAGDFSVTDADDNLMFKTKQPFSCFGSSKIVLYDAAGAPVVTLLKKVWSCHNRWQVFRGERTEPGFLVFSVKRSSLFQIKTELSVFLANNKDEVNADFKVKGSYWESSCVVLTGDSGQVLAQMYKEESLKSLFLGKDKFMTPHLLRLLRLASNLRQKVEIKWEDKSWKTRRPKLRNPFPNRKQIFKWEDKSWRTRRPKLRNRPPNRKQIQVENKPWRTKTLKKRNHY